MQPVISVVAGGSERLVVWHVDVSLRPVASRFTGAWVLPIADEPKIASLVEHQCGWVVGGGRVALSLASITLPDELDASETLAAVTAAQEGLLLAFSRHVAQDPSNRRSLVQPTPVLVRGLDAVSLPIPDIPTDVSEALQSARWLANLADAWSDIERQRLSRPHLLTEPGSELPRSMPVLCKDSVRNGS